MTHPLVHPARLLRGYDGPTSIADQMQLASLLAKADVGLPPEFRGDSGGIIALMYRAQALDIPLMVAADNLVFDRRGGCAMRARLMKALVTVRAGHKLVPVECTDRRAIVRLEYSPSDGRDPFTAEWTIATAQAAGLVKEKSPWINYAANMLYWRAMAKAVALGCPEATLGLAIVEALDDDDQDDDDATPLPTAIPDEIVVTDIEGRPIPDGSVVDILDQIATRDPKTGRPIARPETTIQDLRVAWNRANKQSADGTHRPLHRFAWTDGNDRFTLETVIGDLVEQVTARDKDAAAVEAAKATEEAAAGEQTMNAPAGVGTLPCGCDAATRAATGAHANDCTR